MPRTLLALGLGLGVFASACQSHIAPVRTAALPPPPEPTVRHSNRLWLSLQQVGPSQCVEPAGSRPVCFEDVDQALGAALGRALWTTFPSIAPLDRWTTPEPGDYVLEVELSLNPVAPSVGGPGWAARANGTWQLLRDGNPIATEEVESLSRADFGYGGPLGYAAGEVIDAIAVHIGTVLGTVPETRPQSPRPLPPVMAQAVVAAPPQAAPSDDGTKTVSEQAAASNPAPSSQ